MLTRETITVGRKRFRVTPWHDRDSTALLSVPADQPRPSTTDVRAALEVVRSRGYRQVVTSALTEGDTTPFIDLGFVEDDRLHVLEHDLKGDRADQPSLRTARKDGSRIRIRRGRRRDRRPALEIDRRAFPRFWQLDDEGLADAKNATPAARFRIAEFDRMPVGYSVTGRGGSSGFLQRLAVDPDHQRRGIATALVADALRWCDSRHCERVLVNTQVTNTAALALYLSLGFDRTPDDLVVLSWTSE
jgi:GNAT superfamily N-acetyltransferase